MKTRIGIHLFVLLVAGTMAGVTACTKNENQPPPPKDNIIYTDVNPDTTSESYNLDLNNDGVNDFKITHTSEIVHPCSDKGNNERLSDYYTLITTLNQNEAGLIHGIWGLSVKVVRLN